MSKDDVLLEKKATRRNSSVTRVSPLTGSSTCNRPKKSRHRSKRAPLSNRLLIGQTMISAHWPSLNLEAPPIMAFHFEIIVDV